MCAADGASRSRETGASRAARAPISSSPSHLWEGSAAQPHHAMRRDCARHTHRVPLALRSNSIIQWTKPPEGDPAAAHAARAPAPPLPLWGRGGAATIPLPQPLLGEGCRMALPSGARNVARMYMCATFFINVRSACYGNQFSDATAFPTMTIDEFLAL